MKHKRNNEEWAEIFKEFIQEIDKLKHELETVSERNLKLIKMCDIKWYFLIYILPFTLRIGGKSPFHLPYFN